MERRTFLKGASVASASAALAAER
ncbi:twin-arginine translocation signal domain-containing protein [Rhizobium ruizarguesonis]